MMIKGNFNKFSLVFLAVFHKCARAQGKTIRFRGVPSSRDTPFEQRVSGFYFTVTAGLMPNPSVPTG